MENVGFFSPLVFDPNDRSASQWLCERLDSLCWFEGQRVYVIQEEEGRSVGLWMGEEPDVNRTAASVVLIVAGVLLCPPTAISLGELGRRSMNAIAGTKILMSPSLSERILVGAHSMIALAAFTALTRCVLHHLYMPGKLQTARERLEKGAPQLTEEEWAVVDKASSEFWAKEPKLPEGVTRRNEGPQLVAQCQVFTIDSQPDRIFKVSRVLQGTNDVEKRWKNLQRAEAVQAQWSLDQLVIPRTRLIRREVDGKKYDVLVCENLDIDNTLKNYQGTGKALTTALIQLGRFVLHTGFDDVWYRNAPSVGDNKIGLIDLNMMGYGPIEIKTGIYGTGYFGKPGLFVLCNSSQQRAIITALGSHPNWPSY